jgi:large subunit ribosomal protein L25
MKTLEIVAKKRNDVGKTSTKKLRVEENVPCVMYGGEKVHHFYCHENAFLKLVYTHRAHIVDLDIDGEKHSAIMQDIQFHPVTDKILHIDFVEISENKPVVMHIPIELTGVSIGVKNGGKIRQKRRNLKVKGFAKDLPDHLDVDITNVEISQVVKVGDLQYPNIELLDPHRSMVVSVISSRLAAKGMEIGEEAVAPVVEGEETETPAEETTEKK